MREYQIGRLHCRSGRGDGILHGQVARTWLTIQDAGCELREIARTYDVGYGFRAPQCRERVARGKKEDKSKTQVSKTETWGIHPQA